MFVADEILIGIFIGYFALWMSDEVIYSVVKYRHSQKLCEIAFINAHRDFIQKHQDSDEFVNVEQLGEPSAESNDQHREQQMSSDLEDFRALFLHMKKCLKNTEKYVENMRKNEGNIMKNFFHVLCPCLGNFRIASTPPPRQPLITSHSGIP